MNSLIEIANQILHPTLPSFPKFQAGDTIKVYLKEQERGKERIKTFEGIVIQRRGDTMANKTFTVHKISHNIGVDLTFSLLSPKIDKIEVKSYGKVRSSRIAYIRDRQGKAAKVKQRIFAKTSKK